MDNKTMHVVNTVSGVTAKAGGGTAVFSSAAGWFNLAPEQWTILIGVLGVIVGVLGVVVNGWVRWIEHKDQKLHRIAMLNIEKSKLRSNRND